MSTWKTIALGADHAGVDLKTHLVTWLKNHGYQVDDCGTEGANSVDYPDFGAAVAERVQSGQADAGILVCGSGIGQSIIANRFGGVRAALVTSAEVAKLSRQHNDANVLVLGARTSGVDAATIGEWLKVWLNTDFEAGRHQGRLGKIETYTQIQKSIINRGSVLAEADADVFAAIVKEQNRQEEQLELIASENCVSPAVLEAVGSVLTNKYAEGYPSKRYYGGCEYVDVVEDLAIERAKKLFGAGYVNVQPHSGSQANMAAYLSLIDPGDVVLGMRLSHGGHLTHGSPVNFSGKFFKIYDYGVDPETGRIDYDALEATAREVKPKMIIAGASAYPRQIDFARFAAIAQSVGAFFVVDMAHIAGLVAAGLHPDPLPYANVVTTTTHKTLRGPRGGMILSKDESYGKKINSLIFPGTQGGPLMHVIAGKAVAFGEALQPSFKAYQQQVIVNARAMAEALTGAGISLVSGGTDNHLMLLDLSVGDVTGKDAEIALDHAGITVNKNTVPKETRSPFVTSGIRVGTPAMTTRGMKEEQARQIGKWIAEVIADPKDEARLKRIRTDVRDLCRQFPLYRKVG